MVKNGLKEMEERLKAQQKEILERREIADAVLKQARKDAIKRKKSYDGKVTEQLRDWDKIVKVEPESEPKWEPTEEYERRPRRPRGPGLFGMIPGMIAAGIVMLVGYQILYAIQDSLTYNNSTASTASSITDITNTISTIYSAFPLLAIGGMMFTVWVIMRTFFGSSRY